MTHELLMLDGAAATVAFIHTLLGPDHYLPFVALGKARSWSLPRTILTTIFCGIGHSIGSILLGFMGIYAGYTLGDLQIVEAFRGDAAAWMLVAFGLVYGIWGIRRSHQKKPHTHLHAHGNGAIHSHRHNHLHSHTHIHEVRLASHRGRVMGILATIGLFVIFALGPCETLIPLMMIPAAQGQWLGMALMVGSFTLVTVVTMTMVVTALTLGLKPVSFAGFEKYSHILAGSTVSLCGIGMIALGL